MSIKWISRDFVIGTSDILTAFDDEAIGSKVIDGYEFIHYLTKEMEEFDWSLCKVSGQAYISLPEIVNNCVSSGIGMRTNNLEDYVIRLNNRGEVGLYLKRSLASRADNVAVVVYSYEAYKNDPDVTHEEIKRVEGCSHIIVAVLASTSKPSTLSAHRFVHNLAGGNHEALLWSGDEIRQKAREIKEFTSKWAIVAD